MMRDVLTEQEIEQIAASISPPFRFVYKKRRGSKRAQDIVGITGVEDGAEIHRAQVERLFELQQWRRYRLEFAVFEQ